jgi:hypothetical protein
MPYQAKGAKRRLSKNDGRHGTEVWSDRGYEIDTSTRGLHPWGAGCFMVVRFMGHDLPWGMRRPWGQVHRSPAVFS